MALKLDLSFRDLSFQAAQEDELSLALSYLRPAGFMQHHCVLSFRVSFGLRKSSDRSNPCLGSQKEACRCSTCCASDGFETATHVAQGQSLWFQGPELDEERCPGVGRRFGALCRRTSP